MNFRKVQKKIKTISNVKKITKAMQMVSAVKMRKSQADALDTRPYTQRLERAVRRIIGSADVSHALNTLMRPTSQNGYTVYIVISSDKGLCGSFNAHVLKFLYTQVDFEHDQFIVVGKRGAEFIRRLGGHIRADFSSGGDMANTSNAVFSDVYSGYTTGEFSRVSIVYNRFISSFRYTPTKENFLPVTDLQVIAYEGEDTEEEVSTTTNYALEPEPERLLMALTQDLLVQKIRRALLDSLAAEHSARMFAMKNATDNAQELIYSLTLVRNKLRQSSITNELLEMAAAKESSETRY